VSNAIRKTQCDQLLAKLTAAAERGEEVALPEILSLRIAQYNTRLKELRSEGYVIKNRTERRDGRVLSWYCLVPKPTTTSCTSPRTPGSTRGDLKKQTAPTEMFPEFRNLEGRYPD
jgi:hypothetical protein